MWHLWGWIICLCCLAVVKSEGIHQSDDSYCYSRQHHDTTHDIAWRCEPSSKRCLRTLTEFENNSTDCLMSLKACKLLCDEYASLWPRPSKITFERKLKPIDVGNIAFNIQISDKNDELWRLLESLKHYFVDAVGMEFQDMQLQETKAELKVTLTLYDSTTFAYTSNSNESYSLHITSNENSSFVTIEAPNYLGIHHGIETLTQLIVYDAISNKVQIPVSASIEDSPVFKYRGILLDTSRTYFTVESIKRLLHGMAINKLNTFHWHITDSHSFPYESKHYPKMAKYGAYSPSQVYTWYDIKDIVSYAKVRGIRVLPEFDTPSHTGEGWQIFHNETSPVMLCLNGQPWRHYCVEPPCGILNPINPKVYEILKNLYAEFNELFESDLFHMGGDEVTFNCWNETQVIIDWIRNEKKPRSEETFIDLWASFHNQAKTQLDEVTSNEKKKIILWTSSITQSDKLTTYLDPKRFIIQIWTKGNDPQIAKLLNSGYEVILSNYDALYFDCGFGAWIGDGNNWCSPYIGWQKVYMNRPDTILKNMNSTYGISRADAGHQILGAEAALWSEQADSHSLDTRIWPRAAALAERLWSNPDTDWKSAESRFLTQRERMANRNIGCDKVEPTWCHENQGYCK